MMNKSRFFAFLLGVFATLISVSPALFGDASSASYIFKPDTFDSGHQNSTSPSYKGVQQTISSQFILGISKTSSKLIHGIHFSPDKINIYNNQLYEKYPFDLKCDVFTPGLVIWVEYEISVNKRDGSGWQVHRTFSSPLHTGQTWRVTWDATTENPPSSLPSIYDMTVRARAFDGLSLGPWSAQNSVFVVDNELPGILGFTASVNPFSPNNTSSPGVNDDTTLSGNWQDTYPDSWQIRITSGATTFRTWSGTYVAGYDGTVKVDPLSQVWDGKNDLGVFVADGTYSFTLQVWDKAGNTVQRSGMVDVDNTSPPAAIDVHLTAIQGAVNSTEGKLTLDWNHTDQDTLEFKTQIKRISCNETGDSAENIWTDLQTSGMVHTYTRNNMKDASNYEGRVIVFDKAGNNTITQALGNVRLEDRTAPVIDPVFLAINGLEDTAVVTNLSAQKSDLVSSGAGLTWSSWLIPVALYPMEGSDTTVSGLSHSLVDTFTISLFADHNTDSTVDGNRFGLDHPANLWLRLTDAQGNYADRKLQLNISNVNDKPFYIAPVRAAGNSSTMSAADGPFDVQINEDGTNSVASNRILLDDFVDDIDNLKSSLTFQFVTSNYNVAGDVKGPATNHQLDLTAKPDWYGDQAVSINVYDPSSVLADKDTWNEAKMIVRVWPLNDPPKIDPILSTLPLYNFEDQWVCATINRTTAPAMLYKSDAWGEDSLTQLYWNVTKLELVTNNVTGPVDFATKFPGTPVSDIAYPDYLPDQSNATLDRIIVKPPFDDYWGTVNVTVQLVDRDTEPLSTFPNLYTPNPKTSTAVLTHVFFVPVNDPPEFKDDIGTGVVQSILDEDYGSYQWDLSGVVTDVEDPSPTLTWEININQLYPTDITATINQVTKILTLTPGSNFWGTVNATVTVYDHDLWVDWNNYVPVPTKNFQVNTFYVKDKNDVPSISPVNATIDLVLPSGKAMVRDRIQSAPQNYTDAGGFLNDAYTEAFTSDEYTRPNNDFLSHQQNSKQYHYEWHIAGVAANPVLSVTTNAIIDAVDLTSSSILSKCPELDGKTITVKVWPYDGVNRGAMLSKTIQINNRPSIPVYAPIGDPSQKWPTANTWFNTNRVTFNITAATDLDGGDTIYYKAVLLPVEHRLVDGNRDFTYGDGNSSIVESVWTNSTQIVIPYVPDGHYHWKILAANKAAAAEEYDFRTPVVRTGFLHVDSISPELDPNLIDSDIPPGNLISRTILIGERFVTQSVWLLGYEAGIDLTTKQWVYAGPVSKLILAERLPDEISLENNREVFSYSLEMPNLLTNVLLMDATYNMTVHDVATNLSASSYEYTFHRDRSTPAAPELFKPDTSSAWVPVDGVYEYLASKNVITIQGTKPRNTSLWLLNKFTGNLFEVFGDKSSTSFRISINTRNLIDYNMLGLWENAQLVAINRVGIKSPTLNINIKFMLGNPTVNITAKTRETVNLSAILAPNLNLTPAQRSDMEKTVISWYIDRPIHSYVVKTPAYTGVFSGVLIEPDGNQYRVTTTLLGDKFKEGLNSVTLNVWDAAGNMGTASTLVKRFSTPPTFNVYLNNSRQNLGTSAGFAAYTLKPADLKLARNWTMLVATSTVLVNSIPWGQFTSDNVSSGNAGYDWYYSKPNFKFNLWDINIRVTDDCGNEYRAKIYDHAVGMTNWILAAEDALDIQYSLLPGNISMLGSMKLIPNHVRTLANLGQATQDKMLSDRSMPKYYRMTEDLKSGTFKVYGVEDNVGMTDKVNLVGYNVSVRMPYVPSTRVEPERLVPMKYTIETNAWAPVNTPVILDKDAHKVGFIIPETGIYGLAIYQPSAADLKTVRVYPTPYIPKDGRIENGEEDGVNNAIHFDNLMEGSRIQIFTISGQEVLNTTVQGVTQFDWDTTNMSGHKVASGIYLYVITKDSEKKTGKIAIIR